MQYYSISTIIYFFLFILSILHFQQIHSLRCKCNANRGPSICTGDFCDIHNRDGKRAACGALRRARQTIFACVLIRQNSNDTYCHVIGSTTACWCRQMDFCNADLEAELFDVDESLDNSKDDSSEVSPEVSNVISNSQHEKHNQLLATTTTTTTTTTATTTTTKSYREIPVQLHNIAAITMKSTALQKNIKQSMKTQINPAIQIDFAERIKLTPERQNPPTVISEIISDSYEYALDEDDDGFHWEAIAISDIPNNTPSYQTEISETNSPELENGKSLEVLLTDLSASATTVMKNTSATSSTTGLISIDTIRTTPVASTDTASIDSISITQAFDEMPTTGAEPKIVSVEKSPDTRLVSDATSANIIGTTKQTIPEVISNGNTLPGDVTTIFEHFPNPYLQSVAMLDEKKRSNTNLISNSLLRPIITLTTSTMMISSSQTVATKNGQRSFTKADLQFAQKIRQEQERKEDEIKIEPKHIRLRASSTSPIITYSQSAPKTRLDQWKWEMNQQKQQQQQQQQQQHQQQQQTINHNNDVDNDNNDNNKKYNNNKNKNNSNRILPSSVFTFLLFSLLFFFRLLSL